jgi:hypothetical protein
LIEEMKKRKGWEFQGTQIQGEFIRKGNYQHEN